MNRKDNKHSLEALFDKESNQRIGNLTADQVSMELELRKLIQESVKLDSYVTAKKHGKLSNSLEYTTNKNKIWDNIEQSIISEQSLAASRKNPSESISERVRNFVLQLSALSTQGVLAPASLLLLISFGIFWTSEQPDVSSENTLNTLAKKDSKLLQLDFDLRNTSLTHVEQVRDRSLEDANQFLAGDFQPLAELDNNSVSEQAIFSFGELKEFSDESFSVAEDQYPLNQGFSHSHQYGLAKLHYTSR